MKEKEQGRVCLTKKLIEGMREWDSVNVKNVSECKERNIKERDWTIGRRREREKK